MTSRFCCALACMIVVTAAGPVVAQQQAGQAAGSIKVNGKVIPKSRIDAVIKQETARGMQDSDQLRKAAVNQLVDFELVVQDAERKGLTKTADVQAMLELARQQVIVNVFMQDYFRTHPVSDTAMQTEYNRIKAQRGDREYKARHVLVDTEAEAKQIIAQLDKGAKFEDIAKVSKDPGSKDRGGELDWAPASTYVKPFGDALVKLQKGKLTEQPVQSPYGWHVIRLDDVRAAQFPAFEQVKPQLQNAVQQQEAQKVIAELRAKAKIE
jgi:peptidyl-prolyl cis-trans isomerase C